MCLFVLQNQQQSNILDRLYQIMFKTIILSQIGADRYQKLIFEIIFLSPPPLRELCRGGTWNQLVTRQCSWLYKPLGSKLSSIFSSSSWWDKTVPLFSWAWQSYEESLLPHSFLQTPRRETYRALCCTSCMQFTLAARKFLRSNSKCSFQFLKKERYVT